MQMRMKLSFGIASGIQLYNKKQGQTVFGYNFKDLMIYLFKSFVNFLKNQILTGYWKIIALFE